MTKRRIFAETPSKPKGEDEMREAILVAARDLLRRYGLRKITMEDIATAMGKRKSFLYYYFPGKSDVITAIVEKEFQEICQAIRAAVGAKDNPADRVRAYFYVRSEQISKRRLEYSEVRFGLSTVEAVEVLQLTEHRRQFDEGEVRYLADLILEGVRTKVFRPLSEKEVQVFCHFALSALRGTELELFLDPKLGDGLKARMDVTFDILFNGLLR
jgi:AcrR family transcriptional regulator